MSNLSTGQIVGGLAVIAVIAGIALFSGGQGDGGIDVSRTQCEDIASARRAVDQEFVDRKTAADEKLATDMETASNAYWEKNRALETEHRECTNNALMADPCKEAFEEVTRLYEEIMAEFDNGNGSFNEAKAQEREVAKTRYNECVEEARKPEYYERQKAKCDQTLLTGQEANSRVRSAAEARAQSAYEASIKKAEEAKAKKHAILDGIEAKCNEPGGTTAVSVGGATTASTGTEVKPSSSACTGVFDGNDPDLRKRLGQMEAKLAHAKAAGHREGIYGIDHLQAAVNDLRSQLQQSARTCKVDSDCGDPTPVCCSTVQVGRVYCDAGYCANETIDCTDPEICAGKPAQCVAPSTGVTSKPINISRTIPEVGACSQNLQTLDLQKADENSDRFEITGNIPSWLKFSAVGGKLPAQVAVTYSCGTVQGFGPGTYTAAGLITIYNGNNELINSIPVNISITVTPVAGTAPAPTGVIQSGGTQTETQSEPQETEEPQETPVSVSPTTLDFTYDHAEPDCPLYAGTVNLAGPAGSTWSIISDLPVWLRPVGNDSGGIPPGTLRFEFPCQLETYEDQSQSTIVEIEIEAPDGSLTVKEVEVYGEFTNF